MACNDRGRSAPLVAAPVLRLMVYTLAVVPTVCVVVGLYGYVRGLYG